MLLQGHLEFLKGRQLTVSRAPDDLGPSTGVDSGDHPTSGTVQLSNIPRGTRKDTLIMFLENRKKCGGGTIRELDYDEQSQSATVTFDDPHSKRWF